MAARFRRAGRQYESDDDEGKSPESGEFAYLWAVVGLCTAASPPDDLFHRDVDDKHAAGVSAAAGGAKPGRRGADRQKSDPAEPAGHWSCLSCFIVQAIFSFAHRLTLAFVGEKVIAAIRIKVYSHLQTLSLTYFADHRTGEVVSRLTNDVSLLQNAVTDNLVALLRPVITLIGAAVLLFWLNWRLTLIILTGIPIISLTMVALGRQIRKAAKAVQDALAEAANVVEETVSGIRIVKSFAREPHEIGRFTLRVNETFEAAMRRAKIGAVLGPVIGFMAFASITITLVVWQF